MATLIKKPGLSFAGNITGQSFASTGDDGLFLVTAASVFASGFGTQTASHVLTLGV